MRKTERFTGEQSPVCFVAMLQARFIVTIAIIPLTS